MRNQLEIKGFVKNIVNLFYIIILLLPSHLILIYNIIDLLDKSSKKNIQINW